jgi:hypothetical protein
LGSLDDFVGPCEFAARRLDGLLSQSEVRDGNGEWSPRCVSFLDASEPDRAAGRWYIVEFGQQSNGADCYASDVYHDEYVRDAGAWRFARRRFDSLLSHMGDATAITPFPSDVPDF